MWNRFIPALEEALKNETDLKTVYLLKELLAQYKEKKGEEDVEMVQQYVVLAEHYIDRGRYEDALLLFKRSVVVVEELLSPINIDCARLYTDIGKMYNYLGKFELCIHYYQRAINVYDHFYEQGNVFSAEIYNFLAATLTNIGKVDDAIQLHLKVMPILVKEHGEKNVLVGAAYLYLATAFQRKKDYPNALKYYQKNFIVIKAALPLGDEDVKKHLQAYTTLLHNVKNLIPKAVYHKHLDFIKQHSND